MAYPVIVNTFVSGVTASANDVNTNFSDLVNGISDGTKDVYVRNATFAGALDVAGGAQFAGAVTFSGTMQADSTVRFSGGATFSGAVAMGSTVSHGGAVYNESTTRFGGGATFSGAAAFSNTVVFSGATTHGAAAYFENTARFSGATTHSAAAYFDSTARFTGTATFSGGIQIGTGTISTYTTGQFTFVISGNMANDATGVCRYAALGNMVALNFGGVTQDTTQTSTTAEFALWAATAFPSDIMPGSGGYYNFLPMTIAKNSIGATSTTYLFTSMELRANSWTIRTDPAATGEAMLFNGAGITYFRRA
jgi:cytoskeletal protein CcmA (bactofilin family)